MISSKKIYRFSEWYLDPAERLLLRNGQPVALTPKTFETLLVLVENAGRLVPKSEFMKRVWPETFVEDVALAQNISRLRHVLRSSVADDGGIETVSKSGYRLLGEVQCVVIPGTEAASPDENASVSPAADQKHPEPNPSPVPSVMPQGSQLSSRPTVSGWLVCGAVLLLSATIAFIFLRHQRDVRAASVRLVLAPPTSAITPLISLPGEQGMPAFSPDGSRVAFHWASPEPKSSGIYAVVVGSQSLLRLTRDGRDICPAWSPDGRFVAFIRESAATFSIYMVPALGGSERRVYSGTRIPWVGPQGISFSPDGNLIAFADWSADVGTSSIKVLSMNDSSVRTLTSPPAGYHDSAPAFSPSGGRLAFVRTTGPIFLDEIYVMSLSGGEPKQLTSDHHRLFGSLLWTKTGNEVLFASNRGGLKSLWRISVDGGTPQPVLGPGPVADHPSISPSTGLLAYEYSVEDENLWRIDLSASAKTGIATPLFSAKTSNLMPQFSPDGQKIAFEGDRSGYEEIWLCDADGSNPLQVTRLEGFSGSPRWSPDGRMLAFDSRKEEHSGIFIVDLSNGSVRAVPTFPEANSVVPGWSRDGQWIYFASDHSSKNFQVWKVSPNGGVPVQVTRNAGFAPFESEDQKYVYYARLSEPGIWRVPKNGGTETRIWNGPGPDNWANWALIKGTIYLTVSERGKHSVITKLDIAGRHLTPMATLERPAFYGLTVSQSSIIYSQRDRDEHDVVITRLFR